MNQHGVEAVILGGVLSRAVQVSVVAMHLLPEDFNLPSHRLIFKAAMECGSSADLITVTDRLMQSGQLEAVGGAAAISDLTGGLPLRYSPEMAENYCRIIQRASQHRKLVLLGRLLQGAILDDTDDPEKLAASAKDQIHKIESRQNRHRLLSGHDLMAIEEKDLIRRKDPKLCGITSGLAVLDHYLEKGFQPGSLWIVGARPRIGKSTFLAGIATHNIQQARRVLYIACEMGEARNARRLLSVHAKISLSKISSWRLEPQEERLYVDSFVWFDTTKNLQFCYHPGITPSEFEGTAIQANALMGGLDLILVDYFQLMNADRQYRQHHETRAEAVRDIAKIAGRLNVATILGWQLNRDAEGLEENDKPSLKELADTSGAEQAASGVILLHRWKLYDDDNAGGKVLIAKNQDGPCRDMYATFNRSIPRWE